MSTTTVFGQVDTDQPSTHNKRNAAIVFTVIALFALSFFLGRTTATNHPGSSAQVATHAQLSPANRAIVANDVPPITPTYVEVAPNGEQLSPANRAFIPNDVAPLTALSPITPPYVEVAPNGEQPSPANRALIANDVAPLTALSPITPPYAEVAPNGEQLSPANRALIANDVAPLSNTGLARLSPTNRGQIMNDDVAPVTPLSQANTTSCIAGRPC